jgi:1,4-alpha-glucan branching enzyme
VPALHRQDASPEGFRWVVGGDSAQSIFAWLRIGAEGDAPALVVCNMTPVPRYAYRIGVPAAGIWNEVVNTDGAAYGGTNTGNGGSVRAETVESHGFGQSLSLFLPPLAVIVFTHQG